MTAFTILFQAIHFTPGASGVYETAMTTALVSLGDARRDALTPRRAYPRDEVRLRLHRRGRVRGGRGCCPPARSGGCTGARGIAVRGAQRAPLERRQRREAVHAGLHRRVSSLPCRCHARPRRILARCRTRRAWRLSRSRCVFYRFDFPLKLRTALWAYLAVFVAVDGHVRPSPQPRSRSRCTSRSPSCSGGRSTTTSGSALRGATASASSGW